MFKKECYKAAGRIQKFISIIITVISIANYAYAVKIGDIVKYNSGLYKVQEIAKNQVKLCPYYDYKKFYSYSDWGWFYGDKCVFVPLKNFERKQQIAKNSTPQPEIKKEDEKKLLQLATDPKYLNNLSAKEFRELYKKITDLAVMHPTEDKLKAYVYMTNFLRLKSLVFAHSVMDYYQRNSKYYMLKKIGETSWSIKAARAEKKKLGKQLLKEHKNSVGLMAFVKYGCGFCEKQIPVLQWFHADYGTDVLLVSQNSCAFNSNLPCVVNPNAFKAFNVQSIPTILLVVKNKNNSKPQIFPIGVGLTDEMTMFNRITYYLKGVYGNELYNDKNFLKLLAEGK